MTGERIQQGQRAQRVDDQGQEVRQQSGLLSRKCREGKEQSVHQ